MIVTTSRKPSQENIEKASATARAFGLNYVPRRNQDLASLISDQRPVLVFKASSLSCYTTAGELFFHPNMAAVRIRSLRDGGEDKMLTVCGLAPGSSFLDCTAGLCSDSLVARYRVGEQGTVLALESSLPIYLVMHHGLRNIKLPVFQKLAAGIRLLHGDYRSILPGLAPRSFDVVYFDPMFHAPVLSASSLQPLRPLACNQPVTPEDITMATRVAKKLVVLKERSFFDFSKLGMVRATDAKRKIAYGVLEIKEDDSGC